MIPKATTSQVRSRPSGAAFQARTPAMAVSVKMVVQTGPNAQSGGFQDGTRRLRYQGPSAVSHAPAAATTMAASAATTIGVQPPLTATPSGRDARGP